MQRNKGPAPIALIEFKSDILNEIISPFIVTNTKNLRPHNATPVDPKNKN